MPIILREFDTTQPNIDFTDLSTTITVSGVRLLRDVTINTSIIDNISGEVGSASDFLENPYTSKLNVDILNQDGTVAYQNFLQDYKSNNFTFTEYDNINVFGEYEKDFGVQMKVVGNDDSEQTTKLFLYGNHPYISGIDIQDVSGAKRFSASASAGSVISAIGQTGNVSGVISFFNDPEYIVFDKLEVYSTKSSSEFVDLIDPKIVLTRPILESSSQFAFNIDENSFGFADSSEFFLHFVTYGQFGTGDVWRTGPHNFVSTPIGSSELGLQSLQSVTDIGSTTSNEISLLNNLNMSNESAEINFLAGAARFSASSAEGGSFGGVRIRSDKFSFDVSSDENSNEVNSFASVALAGTKNKIYGDFDAIVVGTNNIISGQEIDGDFTGNANFNFIGAGSGIRIFESSFSSIVGGADNEINEQSKNALIGGGSGNRIGGGANSVILGGVGNYIQSSESVQILGSHVNGGGTVFNGYIYLSDDDNRTKVPTRSDALFIDFNNGVDIKTGDLAVGEGITMSGGQPVATQSFVTSRGYITGVSSSDVTGALGFTPISAQTDDQTLDEVLAQGNVSASGITVGSSTISGAGTSTFTVDSTSSFGRELTLSTNGVLPTISANSDLLIETSNSHTQIKLEGGSSTDNIQFIANGVEQARITTTGVGIGTSSPSCKLHIKENGYGFKLEGLTDGKYIRMRGDGSDAYIDAQGQNYLVLNSSGSGVKVTSGSSSTRFIIGADSEAIFREGNTLKLRTNSTDRLFIDSSGNVGIGTTSPNNKLDVVGSASIDVLQHQSESTNYWALGTSAFYQQRVTSRTATAITQVIEGHSSQSADLLQVRSNGASNGDYVTVNSSGNVGIGTTSPEYDFDVNGTGRFVGNLYVDADLDVTGDITMGGEIVLTGITSSDVTTALGYTPVNPSTTGALVNDNDIANFITGISSSDVTGALGFTPITGISSSSVTDALGFTPISAVRTVTAGGNTLGEGETLAFTAGSGIQITESAGAVTIASPSGVLSDDVDFIVKLTQSEYDAITPDSNTLYFISDESTNSPVVNPIKTVTNNYTITDTDHTVLVSGAASTNITLPSAVNNSNYVYNIKNITTGAVAISGTVGLIDLTSSLTINSKFESVTVQSDGSNWYII